MAMICQLVSFKIEVVWKSKFIGEDGDKTRVIEQADSCPVGRAFPRE